MVERLVIAKRPGQLERADIPIDLASGPPREAVARSTASSPRAESLLREMVTEGQSFWSAVYAPFMSRDLTRQDLRALIALGLERTAGDYRALTKLFNMAEADTKRFVAMLRKYHCHVPPQGFRLAHRAEPAPAGSVP